MQPERKFCLRGSSQSRSRAHSTCSTVLYLLRRQKLEKKLGTAQNWWLVGSVNRKQITDTLLKVCGEMNFTRNAELEKQTYDGQMSQLMWQKVKKWERCERTRRGVSRETMENNRQKIEMEKTEIALYIENQGTQRIEITDEESETHTRGKDSHQEEWKEDILAEGADCIRKLNFNFFALKNPTDLAFMPRI